MLFYILHKSYFNVTLTSLTHNEINYNVFFFLNLELDRRFDEIINSKS